MNPDPRDVRRAAGIFKVLSHPSRLRIVCRLSDGRAATQKELVDELGWPQSTVARHLSELRAAGLITSIRNGSEVKLEIGGPVASQLMSAVCDWVHPETGERFENKYEPISVETNR